MGLRDVLRVAVVGVAAVPLGVNVPIVAVCPARRPLAVAARRQTNITESAQLAAIPMPVHAPADSGCFGAVKKSLVQPGGGPGGGGGRAGFVQEFFT